MRRPAGLPERVRSAFRSSASTVPIRSSTASRAPCRPAPSNARCRWPSARRAAGRRWSVFSDRRETWNGRCAGQSITLVLADDIRVSRGDLLSGTDRPPDLADQLAAHLIWIDADPMVPARRYSARFAAGSAVAQITELTHRVDVDDLGRMAAKTLKSSEIGYCKISLDRAVPFDPYDDNRATGAFVLIDPLTDATVGAGVVRFALRRASNVVWQALKVDKEARSRAMDQRPCILWFTGLSGAGKSTIADRVEQKLQSLGSHTYLLDGDNVRHGLNRDLGFTEEDRVENIRRIAEVARLMADAGLIVIVSFISPFRSEREMARGLADEGEFVEIFVDTPVEVCEARDPKGLYAKARRGDLVNFTGIDSPLRAAGEPRAAYRHERISRSTKRPIGCWNP